ncbi:MAG TPA: M28 family peptidase [Thermomicrobiales bacterium]|nr:M28 family peptidase [Thermomicrobiales bacterium]
MAATTPIVDEVSTLNLMNHVRSLAQWVRTSGSAEEAKAFDYLQEQLTSFGYNVTRYESDALIGLPGESLLTIAGENEEIIPSNGYAFGGVTPDAGVSGEIVFVGFGRKDDYAGLDVTGKIVLADGIAMPDKVLKAFEAGAVALININDDHFHEMCISPVWGTPIPETAALLPTLPTLSVLRADGEYLKARIEAGTLTARIVTKPTLTDGKLPTLIGDLPAESATDGTFALFSGHVDSWHYGAMDNGTANATQLEVARLLADRRDDLKRGVRIAFWSGHSHSRYGGSAWYADTFWHELHERCICHVNIDSVGAITADYLTSSGTMAETHAFGAEVVAELTGQTLGYSRMSRSSDQSFWGHGIPSLFAALSQQGGPDDHNPFGLGWWWHTTEDLLDKVNPENLQRDASVFALALWRLCTVDRLPFDYANVANEIDGTLAAYQAQAGDAFDLSGTRDLAQQLATAVAAVNLDAAAFNTLAIELGRILIPVNYTAWGPFEQDLALGTVPLPGLREIVNLPSLSGRDALYLRTKLIRERNRIEHALRTAIRLTEG